VSEVLRVALPRGLPRSFELDFEALGQVPPPWCGGIEKNKLWSSHISLALMELDVSAVLHVATNAGMIACE